MTRRFRLPPLDGDDGPANVLYVTDKDNRCFVAIPFTATREKHNFAAISELIVYRPARWEQHPDQYGVVVTANFVTMEVSPFNRCKIISRVLR